MSVTSLELGRNLEKYLALAETEDVYVSRNGVIIAKLTNPNRNRINAVKNLLGVLPADMTLEEAMEERLSGI